jgi:hypothetical protein
MHGPQQTVCLKENKKRLEALALETAKSLIQFFPVQVDGDTIHSDYNQQSDQDKPLNR